MNYSNPVDAVPDVSLETRLIITENQCVPGSSMRWQETSGTPSAPSQASALHSQCKLVKIIT